MTFLPLIALLFDIPELIPLAIVFGDGRCREDP